jgi:hypothetical protein
LKWRKDIDFVFFSLQGPEPNACSVTGPRNGCAERTTTQPDD